MSHEETREKNTFYSIIGGSFRVQVPQDHPEAVRRDWKSADGTSSGTKYERIVPAIVGRIEDIQFRDGEYGMQIMVALDPNADGWKPVVALSTSSREAEDLMKKLPGIDFKKEVKLRPFNFEGTGGDEVRGIEVLQSDGTDFTIKIKNFFRDAEKKENINGFPNPEGDTTSYSKDDWKLYFLLARKFLVAYTRDKVCAVVAQTVIERDNAPEVKTDEQKAVEEYDALTPTSTPVKVTRPNFISHTRSKEEIEQGIDISKSSF